MRGRVTEADAADSLGGPYVQRFTVEYDYPVYFTEGVFQASNLTLREALSRREPVRVQRFLPVVEQALLHLRPDLAAAILSYADAHAEALELASPPISLPGGEGAKNGQRAVRRLQHRLLELGIDRHSSVVAIGGGALLDMVGFVAATVHRGVRLIRVPTTVLAQDDSGIGVKNGVNAFGIKNFLGTFAPPFAVINDFDLLGTLPDRDRRAGYAEAVKVALIRDAAFFCWLEQAADRLAAFEPSAVTYLIRRCAELHMRHIAFGGDPFETGSARPLDFGHWAAHKLESLSRHALRHGEAVAIGVALDSRYSAQCGLLPAHCAERVCRLLERLGFRLWHAGLARRNRDGRLKIFDGLREFREHLGGDLTVTMLADIGKGMEVHAVDEGGMARAITWLNHRDAAR
ncbi:MAG: 3-dehydroquinate synthase [Rhodospirillales bacterium]|nr:3-dehydroquinate synthase [Rhodospirillales bacterium]